MIWGLNSPVRRGGRGAKPPETRAAAAHVGCCVVFVCVSVLPKEQELIPEY